MKSDKTEINYPYVTEAFVAVADSFIQIAEDVDHANNLAYIAVTAWNISLYPEDQRPTHIDHIAREYEKSNPGVIKANLFAQDMQKLIEKKLDLCPNIKRTITKIGVEEEGDHYRITTVSMPFEPQ